MCVCTRALLTLYPAVYWGPGVIWGNSPPSCNTNEYLVFTWEVNAQLSLSHLAVLGSLWNFRFCDLSVRPGQSSCRLLVLLQEEFPALAQMPEWCTGIPVLVHWVAIAVFRTAAVGFVRVRTHVCVSVV